MQQAEHHDGHRPGEVEGAGGLGEDPVRVPDVGLDVGAPAARGAGQQSPGVHQDDRVAVDVDDPGIGRGALRYLMGVVRRG